MITRANLPARLLLFLKGMAMGAADSVPGVSGGTIALICGIYEELINSLKRINPAALPMLWQQGFGAFWRHINGTFLALLLSGILSSLILAANTVLYLLEFHFVLVMGFFIGLILASTWIVQKEVRRWNLPHVGLLFAGAAVSLLAAFASPVDVVLSLPYVFFCGLIAICAMILPGLSGAFILILLGAYDHVLNGLRSAQFDIIFVFAAGCALGLLSFSHLLSWTFANYRQQTFAFLTGMLVASIAVLWPWKHNLVQAGHDAEQHLGRVNVLPAQFELLTGQSAQIGLVLLLIVVGFTLITVLEWAALRDPVPDDPELHRPPLNQRD